MIDILTDNDIKSIRADLINDDVGDVRRSVERFMKPVYEGQPSQFDVWFGSILEDLSEECFHPFHFDVCISHTDIVRKFQEEMNKISAEHIEEYDSCPSVYPGKDPHTEHPWGNDIISRCLTFIRTATPYTVWCFYRDVRQAALEALEEDLVVMTFINQGHSRVAKTSMRAKEQALALLRANLDLDQVKMGV